MSASGLKQARVLTGKGFHYENLVELAKHSREESHPDRILSSYVLNRVLAELAEEVGDGTVFASEIRKLEAKYRTAFNLALESAIAGAPKEEQDRRLTELVQLRWTSQDSE